MLAKRPTCALARVSWMTSTRAKAQHNSNRSGPYYAAIDRRRASINASRCGRLLNITAPAVQYGLKFYDQTAG